MIAIIPARGGSKGLPGKNIKSLCGKPLIAYTIEAALHAKAIDRVIVTTDSEEIADVAKEYGAEVPFLRPAELAGDTSSAVDVYMHAVTYLEEQGSASIEKFMVLLPTAPLRTSHNIEEAIRLFEQEQADTLISMKQAETPISWYYRRDDNGRVSNLGLDSRNAVQNRQVNETFYVPNGAIYILDKKLLREKRTYYSNNTISYIMDEKSSVDIDNEIDFMFAEMLVQKRNEK